jgi:hypothetical protein
LVALMAGTSLGLAISERRNGEASTVVQIRTATVRRDLTATPLRLGAESTLRRVPGAASIPPQLLVTEYRPDPRIANDNDVAAKWVSILQRSPNGWRTVYERGFDWAGFLGVSTGDLTGDGHADVLIQSEEGSAGCGPHVAVASVRGRTREIFRRYACESYFLIRAGRLEVNEPVGPCPEPHAALHCFGGRRSIVMRWTGIRLVRESTRVKCSSPNLDPANECRRRAR